MTKTDIARLVSAFAANGGEVKVIAPSRKRFKTWRGKSGACIDIRLESVYPDNRKEKEIL